MEAKAVNLAITLPQLLRRRNSSPDVPEDIMMDHFNDPIWDFSTPSPTASTTSFDDKGQTCSWPDTSYRSSDIETSSYTSSSASPTGPSKLGLREAAVNNVNESVGLLCNLQAASTDIHSRDSPYAEVRAAVPNYDDPSMPVNTFRT